MLVLFCELQGAVSESYVESLLNDKVWVMRFIGPLSVCVCLWKRMSHFWREPCWKVLFITAHRICLTWWWR